MKNLINCIKLEAKIIKLKKDLKQKEKIIEQEDKIIEEQNNIIQEYKGNNEFLSTENATLKQINRKRYVQQEDKMYFLVKREKKLQTVEQMVENKEDYRKVKKYIKEGE